MSLISIISGSASDEQIVERTIRVLDEAGIDYDYQILSAHRNPDELDEYVKNSDSLVFICIAGLSAALPGVVAAATSLPVIGIPVKGGALDGLDAMLSVAQMPPGVPVGSVGLNASLNACLMAARIIAINDREISERLVAWTKKRASAVAESRSKLAGMPAAPDEAYKL